MLALAHRDAPRPATAPAPRPHLRALPPPRSRRAPSARALALYAVGLVAGFLLAGAASVPGGGAVVTGQLALAAAGAAVCGLAALRSRAVARGAPPWRGRVRDA